MNLELVYITLVGICEIYKEEEPEKSYLSVIISHDKETRTTKLNRRLSTRNDNENSIKLDTRNSSSSFSQQRRSSVRNSEAEVFTSITLEEKDFLLEVETNA
jgi:hypothetical protein